MPILATFGAAALHAYPFEPRVVLFLFPAFLVLTAAGPEAIGRLAGGRGRGAVTLVGRSHAPRSPCSGSLRNPPPYAPEPLEPVLRTMRQAWQPGDRAYVYYGGEKAFLYYARRFGIASGDYVLGRCAREDPRVYLRELDAFRGRPRVWLVVTHAVPGGDDRDPELPRSHRDPAGLVRGGQCARHAPERPRARRPLRSLGPGAAGDRHGGGVPHAAPGRRRPGGCLVLPPGRAARRRDRRSWLRAIPAETRPSA